MAAPELNADRNRLALIAAKATFLHERLASDGRAAYGAVDEQDAMGNLLARWADTLGGKGLERRAEWDGLDMAALRWRLRPRADIATPTDSRWVDLLGEATAWRLPSGPKRYLEPLMPVAFEELLVPFVEAARGMLRREAGDAMPILSGKAQATLERSLLQLLSRLSFSTFMPEFSRHKLLDGQFPWEDGAGSDIHYRRFVEHMLHGGLLDFFQAYPALGRLVSSTACAWAESHAQLARRLQSDWPVITRTFGLADSQPIVEGIAPYLSDPHRGGLSASIVVLPCGHPLVYKPRPLDMEHGFALVLQWANASGFPQAYRQLTLAPRDGYGWMEHVAAAACVDAAGIHSFYVRVGGLICLLSLLQCTDIHHENLIAAGEQPVVVDLETLFHPQPPATVYKELGAGAWRGEYEDDLARALSESGFLPGTHGLDFSALGAMGATETPFFVAQCEAVNTDAMAVTRKPYTKAPHGNIPTLGGYQEPAADHIEAVVAGFRAMMRLVIRNRAAFIAEINRFRGFDGRFVARSTNVYGLMMHASLRPEFMRDGAARGILFERLRQVAVEGDRRPNCWAIFDAEARALERMDVPYFASSCSEPTTCWDSPLRQVVARVNALDETDVDKSAAYLERALVQRAAAGARHRA